MATERLTDEEYMLIMSAIQGYQDLLGSMAMPSGRQYLEHRARLDALAEAKERLRVILEGHIQ